MQLDVLTRAALEQILSEDESAGSFALCGSNDDTVELNNVLYRADATKGYLKFAFSHAFPVVNAYGQALHPNVVAISHQSLLHQNANYEHRIAAYDSVSIANDKILGTVVAVHFPRSPSSGWRVDVDKSKSPGIEAVASFAKRAQNMTQVVGQHKTGRHKHSVSMEVEYMFKDCAFAVQLKDKQKPKHETPDDMVTAGWELIPWLNAEEELLNVYSFKKKRIIADWKGRKVVQLMGGINKPVHYAGVGVVRYGAEAEARILSMAASATRDIAGSALAPLERFIRKVTS